MSINPVTVKPIFVIGVHRSGTTLLRFMLSSHSNIYIPPESDFIPRFFLRNPLRELSNKEITQLLAIIFTKYRFVEEWLGDPPNPTQFSESLIDRTPTSFLDLLFRIYAGQNSAMRWGDKTPIYTSYITLLHTLFPDALFIHMIRDPRDSALSMVESYRGREFHVDIFFAAKNWLRRTLKARQDGILLGEQRYLEIFYEDLVRKPEEKLKKICQFIQEDFQPQMLSQHNLAREKIPTNSHFFKNVREPVHLRSVGRWKGQLKPAEVFTVQEISRPLMLELGYPLVEVRERNLSEKAQFNYFRIKYAVLQNGRKFLELLKIKPPI